MNWKDTSRDKMVNTWNIDNGKDEIISLVEITHVADKFSSNRISRLSR